MKTILEPARETPVSGEFDVLVCGGGPAGVAAAVASARAGARTGIVEMQGALGGTWTAGCLAWILDHANKTGVMLEILERLAGLGARAFFNGLPTNAFDPERMKLALDRMCSEAGVEILLHHRLAGAKTDGTSVTHAIVESKSGRQAVGAKVFIDCTGDGDLGAFAGCPFDVGRPGTGATQPMSLIAIVAGLDPAETAPFFRYADEKPWDEPKTRLRQDMEKAGWSPSYGMPTLFWIRDDLFMLMANHEYGVLGVNARDLSDATVRARREVHNLVDGLRSLGGAWSGIRIVATAAHIGVREGRRLRGLHTVTLDDMEKGARHPDAVCRVTFGIDVHSTDKSRTNAIESAPARTQPYDIPLRALIAERPGNLMMAGRCISGDFLAHSSYRVTGNAVAMGEAAGTTAAKAALTRRPPRHLALNAE